MTGSLVHQAFLYDSPAHFAEVMAPVVRAGLERGDRVFVGVKRPSLDALAGALGPDAARVELRDTAEWSPRPGDRAFSIRRMLDELPPGGRLLALGEPVWTGSDAVLREWARYESAINAVFADAPLTFVCLYDRSELPDHLLDHGRCTHGELIGDDGRPCPCDAFVPPERYIPQLQDGAVPPPDEVHEIVFDGDHRSFRLALAGLALERGVDPERVEEFVIAANEVSTNAVVHGGAPVRARAWAAGGDFVCEVSDAGAGIGDPLAGWMLPDGGASGGRGLALSRRLCDALEIVPTGAGTKVHLHVSLGDALARDAA
jgi:anti-sigma regulatory factor (Ser/Thr protein kinase)